MMQTCFLAGLFCLEVRTVARFRPTRFMAEDSKYNKKSADYAVSLSIPMVLSRDGFAFFQTFGSVQSSDSSAP